MTEGKEEEKEQDGSEAVEKSPAKPPAKTASKPAAKQSPKQEKEPEPDPDEEPAEPRTDVEKIKAVQKVLGVREDGVWGRTTDRAFIKFRRDPDRTEESVEEVEDALGSDEEALEFRKKSLRR